MSEQNPNTQSNFLAGTETAEKDALYSDLFQTNSNWELVWKTKTERSKLEIFTNIMSFITPIFVIIAIGGWVYAFIRGQTDSSLTENMPFLCPVINYDIHATEEEKSCKTANILQTEFESKTTTLEKEIVDKLATYIPIKVSNTSLNSKEKIFIKETYKNKVDYIQLIKDFEKVISDTKSQVVDNIFCKNISITNGNTITVQCEIYGGDIGAIDDIKTLGSSRMEATRFIEEVANSNQSKFLLENPPTILSIEDTTKSKDISPVFKTKTNVTLTMKYISTNEGL